MDVSQDWYHIATTPDGVVIHKLPPDEAGASQERIDEIITQRTELCERIRGLLNFPDDWMPHPDWHAHISPGEPHSRLMARATYSEKFAGGGGGNGAGS